MAIKISVSGTITIDDLTAEILEYMTSISMKPVFTERFGSKYTPDQFDAAVHQLRVELQRILRARRTAEQAVFNPTA